LNLSILGFFDVLLRRQKGVPKAGKSNVEQGISLLAIYESLVYDIS
jgi:hypothetical protein